MFLVKISQLTVSMTKKVSKIKEISILPKLKQKKTSSKIK